MVAECLGRLAVLEPRGLMPQIAAMSNDENAHVRWTAITSIRHYIVEVSKHVGSGALADFSVLATEMSSFLRMLEEDPKAFKDVKKAAFLTLNAIVHHDGQDMLIPSSLSSVVLPALYAHMDFKEVHEVDLGPFKHKVDEGLPLRKGAFACMDTILDRHNDRVDIGEFLPKLIFGLGDKEDVCMLCHQILSKLCRTRGAVVLGAVADLTVPLGKTVNKKVKDGQAGTQMERRNDVIRSALRAIDSMQRIPDAHSSRSFEDFISTIMKKDHIRKMLAVVRSERGDSRSEFATKTGK